MEDRHVTLQEVSPGVFYSAVFDGHGGAKVAEFAQVRNLMIRIIAATKPLSLLIVGHLKSKICNEFCINHH